MKIPVPDLGDFADVEVIEVLVKVGDRIEPEDPLVSLETDKATMDVPSPAGGSIVEIKVTVGDRVSTGDVLVVLDGEDQDRDAASGTDQAKTSAGRPADDGSGAEQASAGAASASPSTGDTAQAAPANAVAAEDVSSGEEETVLQPRLNPESLEPRPVQVPDLGDFDDVEIIEVLVTEGDVIEAEQGLVSLETEKATMDVPAPEAGTVLSVRVKVGDRVSSGDEILTLRPRLASLESSSPDAAAGMQAAKQTAAASAPEAASAAAPVAEDTKRAGRAPSRIDESGFARAHASPSVRKLARELGVDLGGVRGSGRKGRVTADDVKGYVKQILRGGGSSARGTGLPTVPEIDFSKFGAVEQQPLSRIQRISGTRVHASWVNIPHVTQHDEADITELEEARQSLKDAAMERGIRLTSLAFVLRACALTLEEFPRFKSSLSANGESVVMKSYTHLGFAADTPNGLVVPVIRDADKMDVYELASALGTLSARARDGKLKAEDMQGGVFTISSLGGIGGTFFTPIVNAPEVAILGVSRNQWRPIYRDKGFVPRLMLPLSLSYDHRVIDGAAAVRFTTRLAETLGEVERLLEATP